MKKRTRYLIGVAVVLAIVVGLGVYFTSMAAADDGETPPAPMPSDGGPTGGAAA